MMGVVGLIVLLVAATAVVLVQKRRRERAAALRFFQDDHYERGIGLAWRQRLQAQHRLGGWER